MRRPPSDAGTRLLHGWSPDASRAVEAPERRPGLVTAATDQDNADALETLRGSFGAIALGQVVTEERRLQPLQLDGVVPSAAVLAAGQYRFAMVLHMALHAAPRPEAAAFAGFVQSAAGQAVLATCGHIAPPHTGEA